MIPQKSHLQLIVKELEKFDSELDKSYNFIEFFDRCRAIFSPFQQEELSDRIKSFEKIHLIDPLTAQGLLFNSRVLGLGKSYVLKLRYEDGPFRRVPVRLNGLEYSLRGIMIWCRKQIIKLIKDEQVEFDAIPTIDLDGFK